MGRIEPAKSQGVRAGVVRPAFQPDDKARARMYRRESANLERVENSQHIQLSFLRKIGSVCKYCERNVHAGQSSSRGMGAASLVG